MKNSNLCGLFFSISTKAEISVSAACNKTFQKERILDEETVFSWNIFHAWMTLVCHSLLTRNPRRSNKRLQTACPGRPPILKIIIPIGLITEIPSSTALAIRPRPNWSSTNPYISKNNKEKSNSIQDPGSTSSASCKTELIIIVSPPPFLWNHTTYRTVILNRPFHLNMTEHKEKYFTAFLFDQIIVISYRK